MTSLVISCMFFKQLFYNFQQTLLVFLCLSYQRKRKMAIAFRIFQKIVLMIFLCGIEGLKLSFLHNKRLLKMLLDLAKYFRNNFSISIISPIYSSSVTGTHIFSLSVQRKRIY